MKICGCVRFAGLKEICNSVVLELLTTHFYDGWRAAMAIRGYLPHDVESDGGRRCFNGSTRPTLTRKITS
jgi:hypothetical protein